MELVYSATQVPLDAAFRNPRFFAGPEEGVTKAYLTEDYPEIAAAYAAAGVEVVRINGAGEIVVPVALPAPDLAPTSLIPALSPDERAGVGIPEDWRSLTWPALRRLAASFSDAPVLNKAGAIAAIEAELAGRGAPDEPFEAE